MGAYRGCEAKRTDDDAEAAARREAQESDYHNPAEREELRALRKTA